MKTTIFIFIVLSLTLAQRYDQTKQALDYVVNNGFQHSDLGNDVTMSLMKYASFPTTATEAQKKGYNPVNGQCQPSLGVLYSHKDLKKHPLSAYYSPAGQLVGLKMNIWGKTTKTSWFKTVNYPGDAAQPNLVNKGYWRKVGDSWEMSVSFRGPNSVCSNQLNANQGIGDRLVINQDTISKEIPLFSTEAKAMGFQAGSCMKSMGQHWFYDLETGTQMSGVSGNLLPIVPMYHLSGPKAGFINAFFFAAPVCQYNSLSDPAWDNMPIPWQCSLNGQQFCSNLCNKSCKWSDTDTWATYHVYFNKDPNSLTCPYANKLSLLRDGVTDLAMGRTCPSNTPNPVDLSKRW